MGVVLLKHKTLKKLHLLYFFLPLTERNSKVFKTKSLK